MFNHVLVPLDGSELSEKALAPARQVLALKGTLTLLSVIDLPNINRAQFDILLKLDADKQNDEVSIAQKMYRPTFGVSSQCSICRQR